MEESCQCSVTPLTGAGGKPFNPDKLGVANEVFGPSQVWVTYVSMSMIELPGVVWN